MLIAVIGGKLQGVEVVYLARKAGWKTLVIDKNPDAPAARLCDHFLEYKFSLDHPIPRDCPEVDFILPAIEDTEVLTAIDTWSKVKNIPLAFDLNAYQTSCSKLKSNALFTKMNLPLPGTWPDCSFPVVAKPDEASGSHGVEVFNDSKAFSARFPDRQKLGNRVVQEYITGPSYSIEVVGGPGNYLALQVTDLSMDKTFDCKRITAPTTLSFHKIDQFKEMALALAREIKLTGIMDVEVILNNNELKLLEIDARFPSQTPMTVLWSTGINMVEQLGNLLLGKRMADPKMNEAQFVIVEHLFVSGSDMEILGEHIMSLDGPLTLETDFFGCNEAITSYTPGKNRWVATMIFFAKSQNEVNARRRNCYEQISKRFGLKFKEQLD